MRVVLGSTSPRRREILGTLGIEFLVLAPTADESAHPGEEPLAYALRVARDKAESVLSAMGSPNEPSLIIACDTIVTIDGRIIGKPADRADALRILGALTGRTHAVISAVSLVHVSGTTRIMTGAEESRIAFKNLGPPELEEYLDRIHFMDKAGAYAAQEHGRLIIDRIEGSVTNVIGFPLRLFFRMLGETGIAESLFGRKGAGPDDECACGAAGGSGLRG
jgi:septum formation protein